MSYLRKSKKIYPRQSRKRQQGVVIVIALFIVALVATMSYVMMARLSRDTKRTELIMHDTQAELYAQGSVIWARDQLKNDWLKQKKDKPIDELPIKSPVNDMNGYEISSTIIDAQDRFNINNISDVNWKKAFTRLIHMVYPQASDQQASEIAKATYDWITPGNRDNEYAKYYASLPVPYRAAHRSMIDASELRLVKGVTPEIYAALKPYVTALPSVTKINPHNAEPPVLALISPIMTVSAAKQLKQLMKEKPPKNLDAFMKLDLVKNHKIEANRIAWASDYFYVQTEVTIDTQDILLNTLMQRSSLGGRASVAILWQNRGVA